MLTLACVKTALMTATPAQTILLARLAAVQILDNSTLRLFAAILFLDTTISASLWLHNVPKAALFVLLRLFAPTASVAISE